jgi:hypothetical protein
LSASPLLCIESGKKEDWETMSQINFDDMEYAAPLRQFDLRTAPERRSDEIATLRGDLATALATVQELNRRMAVVEHRLSLLETVEVTL